MKCAMYARVSTVDQFCEVQRDELRRIAAARGMEIHEEYVDEGVSGAKSSRPARNKLMQDARLGKFQIVLVVRLDRWGRSVADIVSTIQELTRVGVSFLATSQNISTEGDSAMGQFMLNVMAAFAELERSLILERSAAGVARARQVGTRSGKAFGRPKVVFERDRVSELRGAGLSWSQVSKELGVTVGAARRCLAETTPVIPAVPELASAAL